ncbi:hypothetical protein KAR91_43355 [Candidatus Pacearchaeota archaeon]|nr:hypothetical protein [Candidatus Pacearchaeota archaeon]
MNKRGISGVVTAVILIAMVVGLTTIVWIVLSNLIEGNLDEAETGLTKINLNIISGSVANSSQTKFSLKLDRDYDENELVEINFLIQTKDGDTEKITIPNDLEPGEGKTYPFNTGSISGANDIHDLDEISVAPVVLINGKKKTLSKTDTYKFNFEE